MAFHNDQIWSFMFMDINKLFDYPAAEPHMTSYQIWGEYGWTSIGPAPARFFIDPPISQDDADQRAMFYYTQSEIKKMLEELFENSDQKATACEAVKCFNIEAYRACTMIMVSLIDREMILYQNRKNENGNICVGRKATKKTNRNLQESAKIQIYNNWRLRCINLDAFLQMLFSDNEPGFPEATMPQNINRNYLIHGFLSRDIGIIDCIKLITAYLNWLFLRDNFLVVSGNSE